jgi:hypothetical protein
MSIGLSAVLRMVDGKPGHLLHRCAGCNTAHVIDIHAVSRDGRVLGWCGDFRRPSIGEPIRHEKDGAICEYILQAGVQYFLESCSHGMRGQSRHLEPL